MIDWLNVPLYARKRLEFRRIDLVLLVLGLSCAAYYGMLYGLVGALKGAVAFGAMMAVAFLLRELYG